MRSKSIALLRKSRAVQLLAAGHTYEEIAREVGYVNRGTAHRVVTQALTERLVEDIDMHRAVELSRLDAMHAALWPSMVTGDVGATKTLLRISEQRCRLLGLHPSATPVTTEVDHSRMLIVPEQATQERQRPKGSAA
jgi:transposase-like protein